MCPEVLGVSVLMTMDGLQGLKSQKKNISIQYLKHVSIVQSLEGWQDVKILPSSWPALTSNSILGLVKFFKGLIHQGKEIGKISRKDTLVPVSETPQLVGLQILNLQVQKLL